MKIFLIFAFLASNLSAKELPIHRIWIDTDGSIMEGNYPGFLQAGTTEQTKANMDAYDALHRPHLTALEQMDWTLVELKTKLPDNKKRHRWRWDAVLKKVFIDLTVPNSAQEDEAELDAIIADPDSSKQEKVDAIFDKAVNKAKNKNK